MMGDTPPMARAPANQREHDGAVLADRAVALVKAQGFAFAKRCGTHLELHLLDGSCIVCKIVPPIVVPAKLGSDLPYFGG